MFYPPLPFVNRVAELGAFEDAFFNVAETKNQVVCFYGKGGNGKSELFKKIRSLVSEDEPSYSDGLLAAINFDAGGPTTPERVLVRLRNSLEATGINFFVFDYAMLLHWAKNMPDEVLPPLKNSIFTHVSSEFSDDVMTELLNSGYERIVDTAITDFISELPGGKLISSTFRSLMAHGKRLYEMRRLKDEFDLFKQTDGSTKPPEELWGLMMHSFCADINRHTLANPSSKMIFLIDQLEYLFDKEGDREAISLNRYNELLKYLHGNISKAVFSFFMRERAMLAGDLHWKEGATISYVPVEGLSAEHAKEALRLSGCDDEKLIEKIVNYASREQGGEVEVYPVLVDELNTFRQKEPELIAEIFDQKSDQNAGEIERQIVSRLMQNINKPIGDFLRYLHLLDGFDRDFWTDPETLFQLGITRDSAEAGIGLSTVYEQDGVLRIDQTIKRGLASMLEPAQKERLSAAIASALDKWMQSKASDKQLDDYERALGKANEFWPIKQSSAYVDWLEQATDPLFKTGNVRRVSELWGEALELFPADNDGFKIERAKCLSEFATCLRRTNRHGEAVDKFSEAVSCLGILSGDSDKLEILDHTAAQIAANYGESLMGEAKFAEAIEVLQIASGFETDLSQKEQATKIKILHNLCDSYIHSGDMESALECIEKTFEEADCSEGDVEPFLASTYNSLAKIHFIKRQFPEAERDIKRALRCWNESIEGHVVGAARTYTNYGDLLWEQDQHQRALVHYKKSKTLFEEYYRVHCRDLALAHYNISLAEEVLGIKTAVENAAKAVSIYKDHDLERDRYLEAFEEREKKLLNESKV